jgi:cysteine desulfurase family protein (TIGR01976 family)
MTDVRSRFPALANGWARFDGPGGTQVVDTAIQAMAAWMSSGSNANAHGHFAAARETDALVIGVRRAVGALLGADPDGVIFGPNSTTLVFAFTRAVARTLGAGDEIVCTMLDHDANVAPWLRAAEVSGATVSLAPFDRETGRLPVDAVTDRITSRTRWVAVTGASNALGTIPDVPAIAAAAHGVGARVMVDAVHLAPHRPIDVAALGCDALVTSPYKWYGPHGGVLWSVPSLLDELTPDKVRPAPDRVPERFETGTPSFEALAGIEAAARFLSDQPMASVVQYEQLLFAPLLDGLRAMHHVDVYGPDTVHDRTPTVAFNVHRRHPDAVAETLAAHRVAVWSGDYYAPGVMQTLGLAATGGAVRAGVARYTNESDVERLLDAVEALA